MSIEFYSDLSAENILSVPLDDLAKLFANKKADNSDKIVEAVHSFYTGGSLAGLQSILDARHAEETQYIVLGMACSHTNARMTYAIVTTQYRYKSCEIAQIICSQNRYENLLCDLVMTQATSKVFVDNFLGPICHHARINVCERIPADAITVGVLCAALNNPYNHYNILSLLQRDTTRVCKNDIFRKKLMQSVFTPPTTELLKAAHENGLLSGVWYYAARSKKITIAHLEYLLYVVGAHVITPADKDMAVNIGNTRFLRMLEIYPCSDYDNQPSDDHY